MAFIKEKVLEKNRELFESFELMFREEKIDASEFTSWYVDKEREIYFIWLGGGALQIPETYELIWKNRKAIITVEFRPSKEQIYCIINSIKASRQLEQQKDELMNIIMEIISVMFNGKRIEYEMLSNFEFVEEHKLHG
ncbi:MAG: hypothetical protein J1F28_06490 [Oscillospiraceae bacterium]|nr:hypothetical protein [Oscillospiraceae bacterium]